MKIIFRVIILLLVLFFIKTTLCIVRVYWHSPIYDYLYDCLCVQKEEKERFFKLNMVNKISCSSNIIKLFKSKYNRIPRNSIELKEFIAKSDIQNYIAKNFYCFTSSNYIFKGVSLENIVINNNILFDERYFINSELKEGTIIYITNKSKTSYALYGLDSERKLVNFSKKPEDVIPYHESNVDLTEAFEKMGKKFDQ